MPVIFDKEYSAEELSDLDRDVNEAFDSVYNPLVKDIPSDENNFMLGTFKVTIEWLPEE